MQQSVHTKEVKIERQSMRRTFACILGIIVFTIQANAAEITNKDRKPHRVIITTSSEAGETMGYELSPKFVLYDVCIGGCVLHLKTGKHHVLSGYEFVRIQNGKLIIEE